MGGSTTQLAPYYWLLAIGYWILSIGYWLLAGKVPSTTPPRGHDHPPPTLMHSSPFRRRCR
jgi:hypothetical protein